MGIFDSKVGQLLGLNKDISSGRLSICKKCPLMLNRYGRLICNDKMWLNPETGDFSTTEKDGYHRGCGCIIMDKIKNINNICPLERW